MKFLNHLIKKHWLWALALLFLLWLLPKLVNAYALLFQSASDFVEKAGKFLKIPGETIAKLTGGIAKVAQTVADAPILTWLIPFGLLGVAPVAASVLGLWGILDFFKGDETITIHRASPPSSPAPAAATTTDVIAAPVILPGAASFEEFYRISL